MYTTPQASSFYTYRYTYQPTYLPTYLPTQVNLELSIYNIVNRNRLIKKVIEYLGGLVNKIFVVLSLMCKRQRIVPQRYEMSSHLTSSHVKGNFVFINLFIGFPCMESLLTDVYGLCIFFCSLFCWFLWLQMQEEV